MADTWKVFDPNLDRKKEEREYIHKNLTPGIIEAKKRAVEEQHRKFDLLGTNEVADQKKQEELGTGCLQQTVYCHRLLVAFLHR